MKTKILLISALLILSSCSYFRVITESPYSAHSIKQYEDNGKYLVLQRGDEAWHMSQMYVVNDSIHASLDTCLRYLVKYLEPDEKGLNKFLGKKEPEVLEIIHIYTDDNNFSSLDTLIVIPESSILAVKSHSYAKAPSRASHIVPSIFVPIFGIAFLIALGNTPT